MLAGIFARKKRAAGFWRRELADSVNQKKASCLPRSRGRPTPEAKLALPPDPGSIDVPQAIRTRAAASRSRPVELSVSSYGLAAGAAAAGDASAAGDAIAPILPAAAAFL